MQKGRTTDQEDPAGSARAKQRGMEVPLFTRDKLKRKLGRWLPGQNPGQRKIAGIRKRSTEQGGKGVSH